MAQLPSDHKLFRYPSSAFSFRQTPTIPRNHQNLTQLPEPPPRRNNMSNNVFPFNRLPTELRLSIWEIACQLPPARALACLHPSHPSTLPTVHCKPTTPALLLATRESRSVALRHGVTTRLYNPATDIYYVPSSSTTSSPSRVPPSMSPQISSLRIPSSRTSSASISRISRIGVFTQQALASLLPVLPGITHLAVDFDISLEEVRCLAEVLGKLLALKKISLVLHTHTGTVDTDATGYGACAAAEYGNKCFAGPRAGLQRILGMADLLLGDDLEGGTERTHNTNRGQSTHNRHSTCRGHREYMSAIREYYQSIPQTKADNDYEGTPANTGRSLRANFPWRRRLPPATMPFCGNETTTTMTEITTTSMGNTTGDTTETTTTETATGNMTAPTTQPGTQLGTETETRDPPPATRPTEAADKGPMQRAWQRHSQETETGRAELIPKDKVRFLRESFALSLSEEGETSTNRTTREQLGEKLRHKLRKRLAWFEFELNLAVLNNISPVKSWYVVQGGLDLDYEVRVFSW